jgi:hypothetical protein
MCNNPLVARFSSLAEHLPQQRALKNCQRGAANRKKELLYIQMRLRRCKVCNYQLRSLFPGAFVEDICAAFMAIVTFIIHTSLDVQNVINELDLIGLLI